METGTFSVAGFFPDGHSIGSKAHSCVSPQVCMCDTETQDQVELIFIQLRFIEMVLF